MQLLVLFLHLNLVSVVQQEYDKDQKLIGQPKNPKLQQYGSKITMKCKYVGSVLGEAVSAFGNEYSDVRI